MLAVVREEPGVRRLTAGWLLLALLAMTLSTACAVLLVTARMPLPDGMVAVRQLFQGSLVLHVALAVVVWFLSCAAALWTLAAGGVAGRWRWSALALTYIGVVTMMLPLFSDTSTPVLANYIPVLDSPVFLVGLAWFLAGIALCGVTSAGRLLSRMRSGRADVWRVAVLLSIGVAAIALVALAASVAVFGVPAEPVRFELLSWGPGHVLQFVHVLLMMGIWIVLGEEASGRALAPRSLLLGMLLLGAVPVLAAPVIYAVYPLDSAEFRRAFTNLMAWGAWPAAALLGVRVLQQLLSTGRSIWLRAENLPLLLSVLLFLLGCVFGAMIRGESTMVPAHYHGTVGAVTLSYMILGYRLMTAFGFELRNARLVRWQPPLYGLGLILLASALAWSGWLGVPRKSLHVDTLMQYPAYLAAMGLVGVGGAMAVSGAALFVFNVVRLLRGGCTHAAPFTGSGRFRPALVLATVLTLGSGILFSLLPDLVGMWGSPTVAAAKDPAGHIMQRRKEEISRQFAEGVALLNAKQYQAAASALHRVLEFAPQMPEAHVNMGFAMIGLEKYEMARDFFEVAINLRPTQMNAYYGLGIALEGTGDIAGALGAMRTYVHRTKGEDPYLRKANAAIWEWETQLAKTRTKNASISATIPESRNGAIRYPIAEKQLR